MAIDVMYINKLIFVVGISQVIRFMVVDYVINISKLTLIASINKIFNLYSKRIF